LFVIVAVLLCGTIQAQSQQSLTELMQQRGEYYFSLNVQEPSEIQAINTICSVDATNGSTVVCYANPTQYANLLAAGYHPYLMTPPSLRAEARMWNGSDRATYDWDSYLTYSQYVDMMEGFPATVASGRTCTLLDLGTLSTNNHRKILGVRINNGQPDGKPRFLYTSTMHGDEVTGMILMLRLIDELCTSTDARIVSLINNLDIFIFPCTNPDGTYYGGNNTVTGARRANGNNVDLNRHFPDWDDGPHPDGESHYQDEAQWMMDLAQQYLFTMGANYHGGAEVVNYPWDTYQPVHPDDAWWQLVSTEYVTNARAVHSSYMTDTYNSGITNGYAWYTINGSRQDYMNYYGQCRELTLECSSTKTPSASQLPNFWNYNHNAMLAYMEQSLNGVHGVVKDANTQQPIEGVTVTVQNHDALGSWVTSHNVGDFHRPIKGGSYSFKFTKEGYCSETLNVTVADNARVDLEVFLSPSGSCPVECYVSAMPSEDGNYVMGYRDDNTLTMPTNSNGSASTSTVNITPNEDEGFSVEEGEIENQFVLTSTSTDGQYYISYNGYYLTRSTSGWGGGNKAITWSAQQGTNNRWTISDEGISQTTSGGWGGGSSTTYYLFYSNGSFYTGTTNTNNITFYQEGDCPTEGEYTITVSANPANGGTVSGGGSFDEGASCTVTAMANNNFAFENWTENGTVVSTNATYTFTVNGNRNLVANFFETLLPTFTVSVSSNPTAGGTVTGGGSYQEGESCTISATANNGYTFNNWTENGAVVSSNPSYTFNVNDNHNFVANFTFIPLPIYNVSVSANPANGGMVTGGGSYEEGQSCTVTATANDGYTFTNWTENGTVVSTNSSYSFTVNANHNLIANFTINTYTVSVSANPANGGTVTGGGTFTYGQSCTITATVSNGFTFINWTEEGSFVTSETTYTFTVTDNRNFVAHFTENPLPFYTITLVAKPANGGTVIGSGTYQETQSCTARAIPATGFMFENWTENEAVVSTDDNYTFTVSSDRNLTAHFSALTYAINATIEPVEGGTIIGAGNYEYGSLASVKVVPNEHYVFQKWTENGNVVSIDQEYIFTVTGVRNLVAHLNFIDGVGEQTSVAISLYPNPVNDKLTVEATEAIEHLEVFSITGAKVLGMTSHNETLEINTANLPAGIYVIRMTTQNATEIRRFVKK